MLDEEEPTLEEIERVARYWKKVELLACRHNEEMLLEGDGHMTCSKCRQPIHFLSTIQIEDLKRKAAKKG